MKLTKRGKKVRALLILGAVAVFIWYMTAGIWWSGQGWCLGTMAECVGI